ncbi:MAG: MmcQ/YjbR family DNA-binding protein [Myxococcota bacterium]
MKVSELAERIRDLCERWPGVTHKVSHGRPSYFAGGKNFLVLHEGGHHQNTFPHLWCAAPPGVQDELLAAFPDRFFRPPYVGGRGWVGVRLDEPLDWDGLGRQVEEAWRTVASDRLLGELER